MNAELQTLVDRLELVERQNRTHRTTAVIALLVALAGLALPLLRRSAPAPAPDRARYSVVEANRFLLRDTEGAIAGGLEGAADGTLRLVLGGHGTASAHLVITRGGPAQFTLRAPDGRVRAGLTGSDMPSAWLAPSGGEATVALITRDDGGGQVIVRDAVGRARFRAP